MECPLYLLSIIGNYFENEQTKFTQKKKKTKKVFDRNEKLFWDVECFAYIIFYWKYLQKLAERKSNAIECNLLGFRESSCRISGSCLKTGLNVSERLKNKWHAHISLKMVRYIKKKKNWLQYVSIHLQNLIFF